MNEIVKAKELLAEPKLLEVKEFEIIPTESTQLNNIIGGGLMPQELYVIQAATGIGKSTLLRRLCLNILKKGKKVIFISCGEETIDENLIKIACMDSGIPFKRMNDYSNIESKLINEFIVKYGDLLYLYYDSKLNDKTIGTVFNALDIECIDYIIIDYLGCLESIDERKKTTNQFLTDIADSIKNYAYSHKKCIITAMQMNREVYALLRTKEKDFDPNTVDGSFMAKSLGVATKATTCISLFKYKEERYLNVFKNRSTGKVGWCKVKMEANTFRLIDEV